MRKILFTTALAAVGFAATAYAAPMMPTILSDDFAVGALNADGTVEYSTNGIAPDTLTYTRSAANGEVVGYWPTWPDVAAFPVLDLAGFFGGDFAMNVQFDGQDAPYVGAPSTLDVSLTGTGANELGNDLELWGRVSGGPAAGLMWGMEIESVSLYGYSNWNTYVFEAVGTVTGGSIAQLFGRVGSSAVVRGHIDFQQRPEGFLAPLYHPLLAAVDLGVNAGFSGEVGAGVVIPEPMTASMLLLGVAALFRRR